MPPTLQDIRNYLYNELSSYVALESYFIEWLDDIFNEDNVFGQLLGIGLYIDLKTSALEKNTVINILDKMILEDNARISFYLCVENEENQSSCICQHRSSMQNIDGDRYVRVLPLSSMIDYYYRHATTLPPNYGEAEIEVIQEFYNPDRGKRTGLGVIRTVWRGKMGNVWVTSKSELDEILYSDISEEKKACSIRDRLGFYELDDGLLVYVVYPSDSELAEAYVPTSLDACSKSYFFVPIGKTEETWGMTCSLNPASVGMKERVHKVFNEGLTDAFESEIIGPVTEAGKPDTDHLQEVALNRAP